MQKDEEDKFDYGSDDTDAPLPLTVASRVSIPYLSLLSLFIVYECVP